MLTYQSSVCSSKHEVSMYQNWSIKELSEHIDSMDTEEINELVDDSAEWAAEDLFNRTNGFEHQWPLSFDIYYKGSLIGSKKVGYEMNPTFNIERY